MEGEVWLGGHPRFAYSLDDYSAALVAEALARSGLDEDEFAVRLADLADPEVRADHVREWLRGTAIPPRRTLVAIMVLSGRAGEERPGDAPLGYTRLQAVNRRE